MNFIILGNSRKFNYRPLGALCKIHMKIFFLIIFISQSRPFVLGAENLAQVSVYNIGEKKDIKEIRLVIVC